MELSEVTKNPVIRKYGIWIVGGLVAVYLAYKYIFSGSASAGSSQASSQAQSYADYLNAANQYQTQQAAIAAQATEQQNQLNAQLAVTQGDQTVAGVQAAGSALQEIITAQDQLPATIVNAATADSQTALMAAAQAASAGLSAVPGSIQGAAQAISATQQPWDALAQGLGNGQAAAYNSLATSIDSSTAASSSAARASTSASVAANQASANALNTIGTVAAVAAFA
jgi:hypothetical protein